MLRIDVRPMQKLDTYSFIMDFRGGTYCSQVRANSIRSALREWLKLIHGQQDEIKFLADKMIDKLKEKLAYADNTPVLLKGMTNFWTTLLLTRMGSVNLQIVLTKCMGYNLHITKKENWSDEDDSAETSLQEWQSYVQSDDEMEMETTATGITRNVEVVEEKSRIK